MCKSILDSNFKLAVINKILHFHEITVNFTYSQNRNFLKAELKIDRPTASTL